MNKKFKINKAVKIINWVLLLTVLFFIGRFIIKNFNSLEFSKITFDPIPFIFSIIFIWTWLFISSVVYHQIINGIDNRMSFIENLRIWAISYFGLYVPGKIGVIAYRIINYKEKGLSAIKVSYAFFIEMIISIIGSAFMVLISSMFIRFDFLKDYYIFIILFALILLTIIHPFFVKKISRIYYKYIKKQELTFIPQFTYFFYLKLILLQLLKWCCTGFGIFFLINSVTDLPFIYFPFVTGLYAAAAIVSMLAVFAPSGIGVLEGVMIIGLKEIITNALAGIVSILIRLWKLIGEITFVVFVRIILWFINKHQKKP
ncbi:MAG: lysylphosphatidylglycerol synthase domain-containing protein [Bacteroidales bacterium]|nr:lysylphosphatidylglycerol synthase domain-containing protein [Bacteroidales bacterium]